MQKLLITNIYVLVGIVLIVAVSCERAAVDAQHIVDKAIASSGGDLYNSILISFDFRDRHYIASNKGDSSTSRGQSFR